MVKDKKFDTLEGGIKIEERTLCDRCGNDLVKGKIFWHFPFIKQYIVLCHICHMGLAYGMYKDVCMELKGLKNG